MVKGTKAKKAWQNGNNEDANSEHLCITLEKKYTHINISFHLSTDLELFNVPKFLSNPIIDTTVKNLA